MNIYVVRPGDSIWSISRRFGVPQERIIAVNALRPEQSLVAGQSLVIPTTERAYRIVPGDSLWTISQRFGISVNSIVQLNDILNPETIYPGMIIRIPENSKNYGVIETNGFIQPSTAERERAIVSDVGTYLTYITPFSHHVTEKGELVPLRDETIIEMGRNSRAAPLLSVTNISGANFDTNLISGLLNNESIQDTLIDNIIKAMDEGEYYGAVIDFERIPPSDREKYDSFLEKLVSRAHPLGYVIGTALAPKTYDVTSGAWHGAHDYASHGRIVDFVIIMTYEWGWSGGADRIN